LIADLQSLMKAGAAKACSGRDSHRKPADFAPRVEDERAIDEPAISNENSRLGGNPPVPQNGSTSIITSEGKRTAGWKTAAVGVFIVVAVLGSVLWFGKKDNRTSGPEVALVKPPPVPVPNLVSLGLSGDRQEIAANETLNVILKGQYSDGTEKNLNRGVKWLSSEPCGNDR
jgi:hypothetical protein